MIILQGLRAIFDETYPDPVRIVSVGKPVEDLLQQPENDEGYKHSVEFCGGTHLVRSGHIGDFVIVTEEAIAKGIRRIVALTGPKAKAALCRSESYKEKVKRIKKSVVGDNGGSQQKLITKELNDLFEEINQAVMAVWQKDTLRNELSGLKKELDNKDKERKAAKVLAVSEKVKAMVSGGEGKKVIFGRK